MSFLPNIPNLSDFILQSGPQLLANWSEIFTAFNQDHFNFNDANAGKHKKLTLRNQTLDPVTGANQVAIYNKTGTGTLPQLFYMPNNAQTPIQLSYQSIVNTGLKQYSFIAGPFIFFAGQVINFTDGDVVTLTPATTLISVLLTLFGENEGTNIVPLAATAEISGSNFAIRSAAPGNLPQDFNVSYVAIGLVI